MTESFDQVISILLVNSYYTNNQLLQESLNRKETSYFNKSLTESKTGYFLIHSPIYDHNSVQ